MAVRAVRSSALVKASSFCRQLPSPASAATWSAWEAMKVRVVGSSEMVSVTDTTCFQRLQEGGGCLVWAVYRGRHGGQAL